MKQLHPLVSVVYYLTILLITMMVDNPICVVISITGGVISIAVNKGIEGTCKSLLWFLPIILITAVINPLFSHEGITIIGYFHNGNPITLESIWYGVGMAGVLAAVILWFVSVNEIMTTEKIMYLFGRLTPSLAIVFALALRITPRFAAHVKQVYDIRRLVYKASGTTGLAGIKCASEALSASVTWILDDSLHTAESMKCRGYGLPGRKAYSRYIFRRYDAIWLMVIILLFLYIMHGFINGNVYWQYYPYISGSLNEVNAIGVFVAYIFLCLSPSFLIKRGK